MLESASSPAPAQIGPIDAMVFDFDGTLVDSESLWLDLIEEILREQSLPVHLVADFKGVSASAGHVRLAGLTGGNSPSLAELNARYSAKLRVITQPIPEAYRFLSSLDIPCAVATNGHREDVDAMLAATGLGEHVPVLTTIEDVAQGKPDPALYLRAAALLGVAPLRVAVFEDSAAGAQAGREAGCWVVAVNATQGTDAQVPADLRVDSFADVRWDPGARMISSSRVGSG